MSELCHLEVESEDAGTRLDVFLAARLVSVSRSAAQRMVREGHVRVNGRITRPSTRVETGDVINGRIVLPPTLSARPESIPLTIVYADDDLAVIDKPAGMVVHPAPGHSSGTVANALAALYPAIRDLDGDVRPGIVHRLDKDTSGLMVVALSASAHAALQRQIAARQAGREYCALAGGIVSPDSGVIDAPIGRDQRERSRMAAHGAAARPARTAYRVRERLPGYTLLEARLETGRTHQIRVHFAASGHPLAGDSAYGGGELPGLNRQFLHATRLTLRSPSTGEVLDLRSPLPSDLDAVLRSLRDK